MWPFSRKQVEVRNANDVPFVCRTRVSLTSRFSLGGWRPEAPNIKCVLCGIRLDGKVPFYETPLWYVIAAGHGPCRNDAHCEPCHQSSYRDTGYCVWCNDKPRVPAPRKQPATAFAHSG